MKNFLIFIQSLNKFGEMLTIYLSQQPSARCQEVQRRHQQRDWPETPERAGH